MSIGDDFVTYLATALKSVICDATDNSALQNCSDLVSPTNITIDITDWIVCKATFGTLSKDSCANTTSNAIGQYLNEIANGTLVEQLTTSETLSYVAQSALDLVGCNGIGGFVTIGNSLFNEQYLFSALGNKSINVNYGGGNFSINSGGIFGGGISQSKLTLMVFVHGTPIVC
jgi:hypothetical protein